VCDIDVSRAMKSHVIEGRNGKATGWGIMARSRVFAGARIYLSIGLGCGWDRRDWTRSEHMAGVSERWVGGQKEVFMR